jgi:hypothetical protein
LSIVRTAFDMRLGASAGTIVIRLILHLSISPTDVSRSSPSVLLSTLYRQTVQEYYSQVGQACHSRAGDLR